MVPPPLFRRPSALAGGASEFESFSSFPFVGRGVGFDSDDFSALSGGWTDGDGSALMVSSTSGRSIRFNSTGGKRSVTILLFLLDFDVAFALAVVDDMVGDGVVDGMMK